MVVYYSRLTVVRVNNLGHQCIRIEFHWYTSYCRQYRVLFYNKVRWIWKITNIVENSIHFIGRLTNENSFSVAFSLCTQWLWIHYFYVCYKILNWMMEVRSWQKNENNFKACDWSIDEDKDSDDLNDEGSNIVSLA